MNVEVRWSEPMLFVGTADGTSPIVMDTKPESGGTGVGPSPMESVLIALAGCTGMDVVGILRKMRAPLIGLTIHVEADRATEHPKVLSRIHLHYRAWGAGLTLEEVRKAVQLSQDKYCSVSAMLRKSAPITYGVTVAATEDELVVGQAVA